METQWIVCSGCTATPARWRPAAFPPWRASSPSASPSPSASKSASPSASVSKSPSASPSPSASESASPSATPSPSASISPSASESASPSPSAAVSVSASPSASPSPSTAPSGPSASPSPSAGISVSASPSASPSAAFIAPPVQPILFKNHPIIAREVAIGEGISRPISRHRIPSWNIPGRPKKAKIGTIGFNFQTNYLEYWNGSRWLKLRMKRI